MPRGFGLCAVLVCEDEPLVMMWISEELKNQGFDVFTAANADAAVTILESHPDICTVFTDVDMPGSMDGLKLAAAVRHRWPPINIVITTGQGPPSGQDMPERSVFIAKPYNSEQVLKAIRSFA
jgi:CheY-like chemotaxis protein